MKKQFWKPLRPGDTVDIIAPGMKTDKRTLKRAQKFLETWDLKGRFPKNIFGKDRLCSHGKEQRLAHLKAALESKSSQAIWTIRGGYGSFHLLDGLDQVKPGACKIFLGLSDSTSLHVYFRQRWGWPTLHGSNIDRYGNDKVSKKEAQELHKILFGLERQVQFKLKPLNTSAEKNQNIVAPVVGGNLVTLQANFGTGFSINLKNRIFFCEDIGERGYRIDRILYQMKQLGLWKGVRAVVFGQFTGGIEPSGKNLVPGVLKDFAREWDFPVLWGLPSGHGKIQRTLPFGTKSQLQTGKKPTLSCFTGVGH